LPPIVQLMPHAVAGCSPPSPGDSSYPAPDPSARHLAFLGTGDLLCNGTTGSRLFILDLRASPTRLLQITGRGDVQGPVAASVGHPAADLDRSGTHPYDPRLHERRTARPPPRPAGRSRQPRAGARGLPARDSG